MGDSTEFLHAVAAGDLATVDMQLAHDPALARARGGDGVSAVLKACYHRQPAVAQRLAAAAQPLDVWEAAATGDAARLRELIARDPAQRDAYAVDGFYPLGLAVFFGQREAAELLLRAGADPQQPARNATLVRPLHAAAAAQQLELARALLLRGADPDLPQQQGFRPLHQAAMHGLMELARLLVEHGADVSIRADDGTSPLGFALRGKQEAMAAYLRGVGAVE